MSDAEIVTVTVLARFMGWTWRELSGGGFEFTTFEFTTPDGRKLIGRTLDVWLPSKVLESRDALTPVLEKLSDEQWDRLDLRLSELWGQGSLFSKWALTCPPRILATAIAEVLKEGK